MSGATMKSINFSFWSGSRCSVNITRRKLPQRTRSAANEDATATFSSNVKRNSRTVVAESMGRSVSQVTLANPSGEVKRVGQKIRRSKSDRNPVPAILLVSHENKIATRQALGQAERGNTKGRPG